MRVSKLFKRKRPIQIALALALVLVLFSAYFINTNTNADASNFNPVADVTIPSTSTTPTTSPAPMLPQPEDSPSDPYEKVPINEIGTIEIPKIGLETKLYEGIWLTVLNVGPGHWPGTAMPGEYGNTVIAGHRVTHSKPFRNLDDLAQGDEIIVTTSTGRHLYKISGSQVVFPKDVWIADQTPGYRLTLFTCHPPGSARQRYVIYADLVDPPMKVPANL